MIVVLNYLIVKSVLVMNFIMEVFAKLVLMNAFHVIMNLNVLCVKMILKIMVFLLVNVFQEITLIISNRNVPVACQIV